MKKILPVLLILIGLGAGGGAGLLLRPEAQMVEINPCVDGAVVTADQIPPKPAPQLPRETTGEYLKLNNQFVVPVLDKHAISALVILSLSLEIEPGTQEEIFKKEPKIRDEFLQVLFDHANNGGFDGSFTNSANMNRLRSALREVARQTTGNIVSDVLIADILRQDT